MKRRMCLGVLLIGVTLLVVSGCFLFSDPYKSMVTAPRQYVLVSNSSAPYLSTDAFPLYVGAKWTYRNATADMNPEVHPGFPLEREIVAMTRCYDPSTSLAYQCYVLRISKMGSIVGHLYLHRTHRGIELLGIETFPQTGTPNLVDGGHELIFELPFRKGESIDITLEEGSEYRVLVRDQERIPLGTIMTAFGPYAAEFADAFRVQASYSGVFESILARGIEDTWYAPGVGLARISEGSQFFELMETRSRNEVLILDETNTDDPPYEPPIGSIVVITLRDDQGTAHEPAWQLLHRSGIEEGSVFSILSGLNDIEARHSDIGYSDSSTIGGGVPFTRLESGSSVFVLEVRTNGLEVLEFRNQYTGERLAYEFGADQDPILSKADVQVDIDAATVAISVHYLDPDGDRPAVRNVTIWEKDPTEGSPEVIQERMIFAHGKRADGYYIAADIKLDRQKTYNYCFEFDDDPPDSEADSEGAKCQLAGIFDIGGTSP